MKDCPRQFPPSCIPPSSLSSIPNSPAHPPRLQQLSLLTRESNSRASPIVYWASPPLHSVESRSGTAVTPLQQRGERAQPRLFHISERSTFQAILLPERYSQNPWPSLWTWSRLTAARRAKFDFFWDSKGSAPTFGPAFLFPPALPCACYPYRSALLDCVRVGGPAVAYWHDIASQ